MHSAYTAIITAGNDRGLNFSLIATVKVNMNYSTLVCVSVPLFRVSLCRQREIPSADHCIHFHLDSSLVHNYLHQKFSLV